ncbi:cytochrome P450 [Pholiota conissans]|uniref:Cytochrome P450 n=1 Tax=Pholiota conissans TaxID=109636 RepID=A0A9P6D6C8_9AGAR|nr:cytochrome P450 [Pholiota conissans]
MFFVYQGVQQLLDSFARVSKSWGISLPTFILGCTLVVLAYRRATRISVSHVPGPEPESFMLGNLPEIFQSQVGVPDFKYQRLYGDVVRVKGPFGEDRLLISDPKALQYIFHTSGSAVHIRQKKKLTSATNLSISGYGFLKWPERTEISRILMGRGLLWADAEIHKRQRKVMLPGFGAPESKSFVPIFRRVGSELTSQWTDILASSPDQTAVLNVASWLSRATMDSIGEGRRIFSSLTVQSSVSFSFTAAFDYQFGALSNKDNEFMKAYFGLMSDTLGSPPKSAIFMQTIFPVWALQLMSKFSRARNLVHARHTANLANAVTRQLVASKAEALLQGKGNKDILSLLIKANASEKSSTRLTEEEMLAQMRTILLAGHETSATTLCWVLLEIARHPDVQKRLRDEIRSTEQAIKARGGSDFTAADLDNMAYLSAVMKESMRFHPAVYQNYRQAAKDDILPLSTPIKTNDGQILNELPVPKGMKIILSIAAYNRNTEVFGEDAHVYNPNRWLQQVEKKGPTLGVYGNLLTFAGGVRTCIGWRFALYEVLALTVEIINNFELTLTPDIERLRREACLVMLPTLEGEQLKGENLPLRVGLAPRD